MKRIYLAICSAILAFGLATAGSAATYNLEDDFSTTANPSGAWSYGGYSSLNDAGSFFAFTTPVTDADGGVGLNGWSGGLAAYLILKNETASDLSPGTPVYPAGSVTLHPTITGQQAVVRWTAQEDGLHDIEGLFYAADAFGSTTTTDGQVFVNGTSSFSGSVNGSQAQDAAFDLSVSLLAGDTVDFVVGFGSDGSYLYDTTGLQAVVNGPVVAGVPLPAGAVLLLGALSGLAGFRRLT